MQREVAGAELLAAGVEVEVEAVDGVDLGEARVLDAPLDGAADAALLLLVAEAVDDLEGREILLGGLRRAIGAELRPCRAAEASAASGEQLESRCRRRVFHRLVLRRRLARVARHRRGDRAGRRRRGPARGSEMPSRSGSPSRAAPARGRDPSCGAARTRRTRRRRGRSHDLVDGARGGGSPKSSTRRRGDRSRAGASGSRRRGS